MTQSVYDITPARSPGVSAGPAPWAQTAHGHAVPLLTPEPDHIRWDDIAHHLALTCRFGGATSVFYSVAQHSALVADQLPPEWRAYGLLHDAHEAYTGDVTTPVQAALRLLGAGDALPQMQTALDAAIHRAAGLLWPLPHHIRAAIQAADAVALATERRDLLRASPHPWGPLPAPLPTRIRALPWPDAMDRYLDALETHVPAVADQRRMQGSV